MKICRPLFFHILTWRVSKSISRHGDSSAAIRERWCAFKIFPSNFDIKWKMPRGIVKRKVFLSSLDPFRLSAVMGTGFDTSWMCSRIALRYRQHWRMYISGLQTTHTAAMYTDLFHIAFLSSWLKSCDNYLWSNFDYKYPIRSEVCTCHDSSNVVACAKLWPDRIYSCNARSAYICLKIWFTRS